MSEFLKTGLRAAALGLLPAATLATALSAHGDVSPQPVDTAGLPEVGEEWLIENPYRDAGHEVWVRAIEIGESGYTQNCARCHGLGVVSGGLAPDLRYLEADSFGDEWYADRFRHGYTQDGTTKMPAFDGVLAQEAAWAIRTYIETRPDEGAIDQFSDRLHELRDQLAEWAQAAPADPATSETVKAELGDIAQQIETASGAPVADSVAFRASNVIDGTPQSFKMAAETLTFGLSAAQ